MFDFQFPLKTFFAKIDMSPIFFRFCFHMQISTSKESRNKATATALLHTSNRLFVKGLLCTLVNTFDESNNKDREGASELDTHRHINTHQMAQLQLSDWSMCKYAHALVHARTHTDTHIRMCYFWIKIFFLCMFANLWWNQFNAKLHVIQKKITLTRHIKREYTAKEFIIEHNDIIYVSSGCNNNSAVRAAASSLSYKK